MLKHSQQQHCHRQPEGHQCSSARHPRPLVVNFAPAVGSWWIKEERARMIEGWRVLWSRLSRDSVPWISQVWKECVCSSSLSFSLRRRCGDKVDCVGYALFDRLCIVGRNWSEQKTMWIFFFKKTNCESFMNKLPIFDVYLLPIELIKLLIHAKPMQRLRTNR